jgi:excisionase family DNA binding protein
VTPAALELLTIDEAAAILRMSKTTFRRRLDRGEFTIVRDRRMVLVPRAALLEYLSRHTRPARDARDATSDSVRRAAPPTRARSRSVHHLWETDGRA